MKLAVGFLMCLMFINQCISKNKDPCEIFLFSMLEIANDNTSLFLKLSKCIEVWYYACNILEIDQIYWSTVLHLWSLLFLGGHCCCNYVLFSFLLYCEDFAPFFFQQSKIIYIRMYVNSTDYGLLHLKWFTLYFVFCGDKNRCGLWLAVICNVHLLLAVDSVYAMKLPCVTGCFITSK